MSVEKFDLYNIFVANFVPTQECAELTKQLKRYFGFESNYEVARLALGYSLSQDIYPEITSRSTSSGMQIKGDTLFDRNNAPLWVGLLSTNYLHHHKDVQNIQLGHIQNAVKAHWHNGVIKLNSLWEAVGNDTNKFWEKLASTAGLQSGQPGVTANDDVLPIISSGPISLKLGHIISKVQDSDKPFVHILNGVGYSPHIAIMGQAGSGKTRVMTSLVKQIRDQTKTPVLLMDLGKGDLAFNKDLLDKIGARTISVPENPIPLDMCFVDETAHDGYKTATINFVDAFTQISSGRPGDKQGDNLLKALLPLFQSEKQISFQKIKQTIDEYYEENGLRGDIVTATANKLSLHELFRPEIPPKEFFSKSWLITFANARSEAKAFSVCLLLSALDMYLKSLDETPTDSNNFRSLRIVVAIDEARELLNLAHNALGTNIRLHRAKGLSVILVSQSPDDYDGKRDDYLENIGLPVCLKTNANSTRVLKNMLKGNVDFAGLKPNTAFSVDVETSKPVQISLEYYN